MSARDEQPAIDLERIDSAWNELWRSAGITVIRTRKEHARMVELMDRFVDEVGAHESHRLSGLLGVVATLVHQYEKDHVRLPPAEPREVLRFLVEQHGLRQTDLKSQLGSQGVVSEILAGKREINARQARALATRFGVSPAAFL